MTGVLSSQVHFNVKVQFGLQKMQFEHNRCRLITGLLYIRVYIYVYILAQIFIIMIIVSTAAVQPEALWRWRANKIIHLRPGARLGPEHQPGPQEPPRARGPGTTWPQRQEEPAKEAQEEEFEAELAKLDIDPEEIIHDEGYKKHLKRHANKWVLGQIFNVLWLIGALKLRVAYRQY